jgi:hypothetical protein
MNKEVPPAREDDNQVLAATANVGDVLTVELVSDRLGRLWPGQPAVEDRHPLEGSAAQDGSKGAAYGLDLG